MPRPILGSQCLPLIVNIPADKAICLILTISPNSAVMPLVERS